jgi:hypothetical protein
MSRRGFQTWLRGSLELRNNSWRWTMRCRGFGLFRRQPSCLVVARKQFGVIWHTPQAPNETGGDAIHRALVSRFLPCLSSHARRVISGARRHGAALLHSLRRTPFGSWFLPKGHPPRKRDLALGSRASRSGFANG